MIKLTNTLTGQKEEFVPLNGKKVNMFVCGPTVYDYIHIGNARTFVFFDVVAKYLKSKGYQVKYIQNITDIDDKIIKRAHDEEKKPEELAEEYSEAFFEDMSTLGVNVDKYAKASDYIPQIIAQVQRLIERGYAYAVPTLKAGGQDAIDPENNQDVYFDIEKYEKDFPGQYGCLSGQITENLEAEKRIEMEKNKRHPRDFVLWKAQNYLYDWATDSPWGKGRPGWHIEDTAISEHFFGPQYDLHGGGQDLKFPHHEAEIAQQQAASGQVPFVKYWIHTGFLINKGRKMAKSTGNFTYLREILKNYSPEVLRHYFLSAHYRSPLDFSEKILNQSAAAIQRISEFKNGLELAKNSREGANKKPGLEKIEKEFLKKMDNDFNTSEALGQLFNLIRIVNPVIKFGLARKDAEIILKFIQKMNEILGIIPPKQIKIPAEIRELVAKREKLREENKWVEADKTRAQIEDLGWRVEDTIYGPLIKSVV